MSEERLSGLAIMQIRCTEVPSAAPVTERLAKWKRKPDFYCNYIMYNSLIFACLIALPPGMVTTVDDSLSLGAISIPDFGDHGSPQIPVSH